MPVSEYARSACAVAAVLLGGGAAVAQSMPVRPAYCAHVPPPSQTLPGATSFTYRTIGTRTLRIHVFGAPEGPARRRPAILYFFGGGFRVGDVASFGDLAKALTARGYVPVAADYRVLCRDGVTAVAGVGDAEAALAWLRTHAAGLGIDRRRIVLSGGSAGGLLAASTALRASDRERPAALVLFNPALDLESGPAANDQTAAQAKTYSASRLPLRKLPPTIIFHGTADHTVLVKVSRDFCTRALAVSRRCELVEYAGMDHSFSDKHAIDPSLHISPFDDTLNRALAFLDPIVRPRMDDAPR